MARRSQCAIVISFLTLICSAPATAEVLGTDPRWNQADQLEAAGHYEAAIAIYTAILGEDPKSQRAMTRRSLAHLEALEFTQALADAEASIALNPLSRYWAERAYLAKAKACSSLGCHNDVREALAVLRARFPDARATTEVEVIEAGLDGNQPLLAEARLELEEEAAFLHEQANEASMAGNAAAAESLFDQVISGYPSTRQALRSKEIRALLLGLQPERTEDALEAWQDILEEVEAAAPQSRIAQEATMRMAALKHRQGKLADALGLYAGSARDGGNAAIRSNSLLQAAGVHFELHQRALREGREVAEGSWSAVRASCRRVIDLDEATPQEKAIAEIMFLETHNWEGESSECLRLANEFLTSHDVSQFPQAVGTAHLFAGESHLALGAPAEAAGHFDWIVTQDEEGTALGFPEFVLARAYFRAFTTARASGASDQELGRLAQSLEARFPDSNFTRAAQAEMASRASE